jgi:hypothetical protein
MATKKHTPLKAKTTRRAAKPAKAKARRPDSVILQFAERRAELLADRSEKTEEAMTAHNRKVDRLNYGIIDLPAESLAGLRVKARILAEEQIIAIGDHVPAVRQAYSQSHRKFADRLAFSIWADAERLAKEGGAS